jgi:hypothetical protein
MHEITHLDTWDEDTGSQPPSGARSLAEEISPDDWRLYHLMRELPNEDRARVIAFAELLATLRQAAATARQRQATPRDAEPR